MKSDAHKNFEKQIARIHQLLEAEGTVLTWNDRIADPDNKSQLRQIDVTLRRDDALTLIECRFHRRRQDVKWIEELIGRRQSLNADAVIAVSSSGFTETAKAKAQRFGVHLRDFATLTDREIRLWGRRRNLKIVFTEFDQACLNLVLPPAARAHSKEVTDLKDRQLSELHWVKLFQSFQHQLDRERWSGAPGKLNAEIAAGFKVGGADVSSASFTAQIRRVELNVELAAVFEYCEPLTTGRQAEIGHFELGNSEIIEHSDDVSVTIDLSSISAPDNCFFETVNFDAGRIVSIKKCEFIGMHHALRARVPVQICVDYAG